MTFNSDSVQLKALRNKTPLPPEGYAVNTRFYTDARVGGCR